jgi:DNA polymerase III psi subunit
MDTMSLCSILSVRDPGPGESRMTFHFTRKPESSSVVPTFDDVIRSYDLENTQVLYTEVEELLSLYVFAAGHDWTAHGKEIMDICHEMEIFRDWRLVFMAASTCVDNTE